MDVTAKMEQGNIKAAYKNTYANNPFYKNRNVICGYVYTLEDVKKESINYLKSILKKLEH